MMNQDYDRRGLWSIGKTEYKKIMNIKFKKTTSTKAFLWGILFTAIPVLPLAWTLFEVIEVYWYNPNTVYLFLAIAWALFMFCNGLSNYISIKMLKVYEPDMTDLQQIRDKAVFFYQTLNPGFGIFIFIILVFFLVSSF